MEVEPAFDGQQAASAESEAVLAQQAMAAGQPIASAKSEVAKQPPRGGAAGTGRSKKSKVWSAFQA